MSQNEVDSDSQRPLTLVQLLGSVLAAMFGVQSSKNRERDFARGRPLQFVILGVAATAAFVLTVWSVVKLVLFFVGAP